MAWSVVVTGLVVFVFPRPFSGSQAVAWFFRELKICGGNGTGETPSLHSEPGS